MEEQSCPFCGSQINPSQFAEMRKKIRDGQDPAILREMEQIRNHIQAEEKGRADQEIAVFRLKLKKYQERENELDRRESEAKAREATIEGEILEKVTARAKIIREEAEQELSLKHGAELQGRDRQIADLRLEISRQKESQEQEIETILLQRETQIREEEKTRAEVSYGPLRKKLAAYQERESDLLKKEENLRIQTEELQLTTEKVVRERETDIRRQERLKIEKTYEPLKSRIEEYQRHEEEVLRREETLSLREAEVDLRVAREVAERRESLLEDARKQAEEKHGIELKENAQVISELRAQLEEAQRLIQSGSAQRRGLIQQLELGDRLEQLFPEDEIVRISSGVRGADVLQNVRATPTGKAGSIYWESKRTKEFQQGWLRKLRGDQQQKKADVGAIVTDTLPDGVEDFAVVEGVVIVHPRILDPVATLIRQYLLNLARQKLTLEQRDTKVHQLFKYMTGNDFLQRIAAIVDAQSRLSDLTDKERRAHERVWAARDQLHTGIGRNIAGLYGDIEGIVGALPAVQGLQLPAKTKKSPDDDK